MNLLDESEPPPVQVLNPASEGRLLLTADHAGRRIPKALGDLGLPEGELARHIAWDIGIAGVTARLADLLGTVAVLQTYSRLVIDCNRRPDVPSAFPRVSEATEIPGNAALDDAAKLARRTAIFDPYHDEIARQIAVRRRVIYVAMHSFTPVFLNVRRPMHVALLYNRRPALSRFMAALLRAEGDLLVAENDPYQVSDATDYGVPVHAERAGLDYLEIEIRQDLIETEAGQEAWARRLARLLPLAVAALDGGAR